LEEFKIKAKNEEKELSQVIKEEMLSPYDKLKYLSYMQGAKEIKDKNIPFN